MMKQTEKNKKGELDYEKMKPKFSQNQLDHIISQTKQDTREEVIEEIKKKLPTHKGKTVSRTEIKKILDKLAKKK